MLITKEQQEAIVDKYIKEKHTTDEVFGFIDGINSTIELINKLTIPVVMESNFICAKENKGEDKCKEQCGWCEGNN